MNTDAELSMQEGAEPGAVRIRLGGYMLLRDMIQDEKSDGLETLAPLRKEIAGIWEEFKDNAPPGFRQPVRGVSGGV